MRLNMKRNPFNTNQSIHNDAKFNDFDVLNHVGCLINNHLQRTYECLQRALEKYNRVCVIRFDLYVPEDCYHHAISGNQLIGAFIASLRAKIAYSQRRSRALGNRVHETDVDYIWCREVSTQGRLHYHVAILLNHNAYAFIGRFNLESNNLYSRIHQAWASALAIYSEDILGYVHIPRNPFYEVIREDFSSINEAFKRLSYFSKQDSKEYSRGFHTFGCSR